jgi:hypothetical protein
MMMVMMIIKSRRMGCAGHIARMGKMKNAYEILVGKCEWKRSPWRTRNTCDDNIRKEEAKIYGLDSCASGQGIVAGSCEYGNEISGSTKGGEFLACAKATGC